MWSWIAGGFLVFLVMTMGTVAFAVNDSGPVDCDDYEFNATDWASGDDTDDEAADLVRCNTLHGKNQAQVLRMLWGNSLTERTEATNRSWTFRAGEVDSYTGTEPQRLYVSFNGNGIVTGTRLAYPEAD